MEVHYYTRYKVCPQAQFNIVLRYSHLQFQKQQSHMSTVLSSCVTTLLLCWISTCYKSQNTASASSMGTMTKG